MANQQGSGAASRVRNQPQTGRESESLRKVTERKLKTFVCIWSYYLACNFWRLQISVSLLEKPFGELNFGQGLAHPN